MSVIAAENENLAGNGLAGGMAQGCYLIEADRPAKFVSQPANIGIVLSIAARGSENVVPGLGLWIRHFDGKHECRARCGAAGKCREYRV